MKAKSAKIEAIIDSMEAEERGDPALLLAGDSGSKARIARIAKACDLPVEDVQEFTQQFRMTSAFLEKSKSGKSPDMCMLELKEEEEQRRIARRPRSARRALQKKRKQSKQAEWMSF